MIKQLPLSVPGARKDDVRSQFAALCYRLRKSKKKPKVQILLITSRGTGRWIVPKGWPMHGKTPAQTAVQEAWEEAGVKGRSSGQCLGIYSYSKERGDLEDFPVLGMIYPVEVLSIESSFPEQGQRDMKWVSRKTAAKMVDEPELARIIRDFDPREDY